jgi:hypothetical protein
MTEILSLGNLLRLARDTVSNPREGAATVLSFAPERAGAVADVRAGDRPVAPAARGRGAVHQLRVPTDGPIIGPMQNSPIVLGS